jgi:mono/diheme cytochrome c family protein
MIASLRLNVARQSVLALLAAGLVWAALVALAQAAPLSQSADAGQAIFEEKCVACHTIGGGRLVGPDLQGVTTRRERDWLARWIAAPDKLLAEGDPIAAQLFQEYNNVPMPNQGLTEAEVAALLAYLETQTAGAAAAPAAPALLHGNPLLGEDLFRGVYRFQNGGPPCLACHTIGGIGALGGGVLGPDLSPAFAKYGGEAGVAAVLADIPFPTMKPIFDARPLTAEEQADLRTFLKMAAGRQPARQTTPQLGLLAGGGFVVLLLLAQVVWRRRLRGVRRPLVERA